MRTVNWQKLQISFMVYNKYERLLRDIKSAKFSGLTYIKIPKGFTQRTFDHWQTNSPIFHTSLA